MTVISSHASADRSAPTAANWLASPLFFWGALALYLAAHVALRLWETPNLGKNDVQEALAAQGWAWGYHPRNPPLHTWLLMGSYYLFGVGLVAHVILKYVLLGATYVFAWLSARILFARVELATLGAFSLTLLTPFAWTVHTALTHTLLLAALIFATLWAALRVAIHRRLADYAVLGFVIGLGLLAKYSYPLFLLPFLAAVLCQADLRRTFLHPRLLLTLGVALLVFAPHGLWMATARFDFIGFLADKQRSEVTHSYLLDVGTGLGNVAVGAMSFLAPLILVSGLLLHGSPRSGEVGEVGAPAWGRVLMLAPVFGLGLLLADVILFRATQFEERYFMCALLLAPLALFGWLDRRSLAVSDKTCVLFGASVLAGSLIVFSGLVGRALIYNRSCDRCLDEMAVGELVRRVRADAGFERGTIVSDHYDLAGNMRIAFPRARVYAANYVVESQFGDASGQCLLVWNARRVGDAAPELLTTFLAQRGLTIPPGEPRFVEAPLLRSGTRMDRLAYWVLPNADGACKPRRDSWSGASYSVSGRKIGPAAAGPS